MNFFRTPRARVPTILQMEAVECGAACLAMVLAHHGLWVPLEDVRNACGVSRDGSKATSILRAARSYGMTTKGLRAEPSQITSALLPAIIFWDFNHFVVLESVGRKKVYINDPAAGQRTISHEEFNASFTGVMLTMEPGPDFQRSGSPPSVWRTIASRLAYSKATIAFLVIAGIVALLPGLFVPAATKIFIDDILVHRLTDWFRPLLVGLAVAAVLQGLLTWLQGYYLSRLQRKLGLTIGLQLTWHLLRLPHSFFSQRYAGDVASRLHSAERICELIGSQVTAFVVAALATMFYGALMFVYDPWLALIGMTLAATNALFAHLTGPWQENAARNVLREQAILGSISINGVQAIETLKATGSEDDFFARWSGTQARMMNAVHRMQVPAQLLGLGPGALGAIAMASVLGVGGLRVMDGIITVGTLAAFQTVLSGFLGHVGTLVKLIGSLRELRANLERVNDVMRYPLDRRYADPAPAQQAHARRLRGAVDIDNLVFGYNPLQPPLINGFSLSAAPGARIALVGRSGSGKSTIARLLAGLGDPWSGEIRYDGVPADQLASHIRAASIGFVDQNIVLLEGSVRQNLSLWDRAIREPGLIRAARDAHIHDVIAARPGGYDAMVSDGAVNWSGGQAQRLEIARALVTEPSILVLDEATSALDAISEAQILDNLRQRGCTIILVTHRLSAIRDCDEILVLDQGQVIQRGTHEALRDASGAYAELIRAA
jgi:NHLM bacteriocin system ABC transporter peptidase/ATP-binding protein